MIIHPLQGDDGRRLDHIEPLGEVGDEPKVCDLLDPSVRNTGRAFTGIPGGAFYGLHVAQPYT